MYKILVNKKNSITGTYNVGKPVHAHQPSKTGKKQPQKRI